MVVCVVYWRCLKGAVVRLISCNAPLKASRLLWVNTLDGSLFHCSGKAVFVVVVGGGYLSVFVRVFGSCLAVSRREVLAGIDKRLFVILYMVVSLASALLCSTVGQERLEAKVDPDVSQLYLWITNLAAQCWMSSRWLMFRVVYGSHTGQQTPIGIALDGLGNSF